MLPRTTLAIQYSDTLNPDIAIAIDDDYINYWFFESVLTGYKTLLHSSSSELDYDAQYKLAMAGHDIMTTILELGVLLEITQLLGHQIRTDTLEFEGNAYLASITEAYTGDITDNIRNYATLKGKHQYLYTLAKKTLDRLYADAPTAVSQLYKAYDIKKSDRKWLAYHYVKLDAKSLSPDTQTAIQNAKTWRAINDSLPSQLPSRQWSGLVMPHDLPSKVQANLGRRYKLKHPVSYYDGSSLIIIKKIQSIKRPQLTGKDYLSLFIKKAIDKADILINNHYIMMATEHYPDYIWLPPIQPAQDAPLTTHG